MRFYGSREIFGVGVQFPVFGPNVIDECQVGQCVGGRYLDRSTPTKVGKARCTCPR
jgi:hypothetical protein